eukprot:jgi/Bigna1/81310/fgenesh1_pg.79_\
MKYGNKITIGPDQKTCIAGPCWIFDPLKWEEDKKTGDVTVKSVWLGEKNKNIYPCGEVVISSRTPAPCDAGFPPQQKHYPLARASSGRSTQKLRNLRVEHVRTPQCVDVQIIYQIHINCDDMHLGLVLRLGLVILTSDTQECPDSDTDYDTNEEDEDEILRHRKFRLRKVDIEMFLKQKYIERQIPCIQQRCDESVHVEQRFEEGAGSTGSHLSGTQEETLLAASWNMA